MKHLREENNSKNEIIKILPENISSIAFSTNAQVQRREITQTSNSSTDMLCQVPNKFTKHRNSSNRFENPIDLKIQDCRMTLPTCHFRIKEQIIFQSFRTQYL